MRPTFKYRTLFLEDVGALFALVAASPARQGEQLGMESWEQKLQELQQLIWDGIPADMAVDGNGDSESSTPAVR